MVCILVMLTGCGKKENTGSIWLVESGAPTSSTEGKNGDMYLDNASYDLYQMIDQEWVKIGNISGEVVENGTPPSISINKDGYWVIDGVVTTIKAQGENGKNGTAGVNGTNGKDGTAGADGKDGKDGKDGITPTISINEDGYWVINGVVTTTKAQGEAGKDGNTPSITISDAGFWVIDGVETSIKAGEKVICRAVTESTRLQSKYYPFAGIGENRETILSTTLEYIGKIPEGNYEPGDEYLCEVKPGTTYRFYVLNTEGDTVNLIMDQNITSDGTPATAENTGLVPWISNNDYVNAGGTLVEGCDVNADPNTGSDCAKFDKGPITAMNYLKNAVSSWTNIDVQDLDYTLYSGVILPEQEYASGIYSYSFKMETRARMIYAKEAQDVGCWPEVNEGDEKYYFNTCPLWLSNNLQFKSGVPAGATSVNGVRGFWTLTPTATEIQTTAFEVLDHVNINAAYLNRENYNGVRPVISVSKANMFNN